MYAREHRVPLRHYLEQGLSKTAIARTLRVSRRTVYHWINTGQLDRELDDGPVQYAPRPPVGRKIDGYRAIIEARLTEYPRLSATRLYEEIRAAGYPGGYTQVKEYVREARPGAVPDPVVRFETPPGLQAQVDFAELRLPWGKRFPLLVVLGYSRLLWIQFYPRQTSTVLMRGLEEGFTVFGGVPSELLFDQMKAVIIDDHREMAASCWRTSSLHASRRTGAFGSAPAVRIAPGRRVKWSVRSVTCARASFMAESSSTMRI